MLKKVIPKKGIPSGFKLPIIGYQLIRRDYIIILVLGLALLAYYKKGWFVAATVNSQPISSIEINQKLNTLYKEQVLGQIINERILQQEADKKGLIITKTQIDEKIKKLEEQYGGGETLDSILAQQGMTREDLRSQTKVQLIVEKLYGDEASPSEEEIVKFMQDNKDTPEATNEARFRQIAQEQTKQEKLSKIFAEKFQALKQSAKIQIF